MSVQVDVEPKLMEGELWQTRLDRRRYRHNMEKITRKQLLDAYGENHAELLVQIREVNAKMSRLEERIANVEETKPKGTVSVIGESIVPRPAGGGHEGSHDRVERYAGSLSHVLARRVTTIVGLHEAMTHESRCFRSIWALLVLVGIGATVFCLFQTANEFIDNPTAASVQLHDQKGHVFPPLLLCPDSWPDVEKAITLGMSIEMLKYALSYPDDLDQYQVPNVSLIRDQFYSLYKQHKFKSLLDFYDAISPDFQAEDQTRTYTTESTYFCSNCVSNGKLDKTMLESELCHVIHLKPIEKGFGVYADRRAIRIINYKTQTMGLYEDSLDWHLYFPTYQDSFISMYPKLTVRSFFHNWVRFDAQRFIALGKPDEPCQKVEEGSNYSSVACISQCHNNLYQQRLNCHLLWISNASSKLQPWDYCNFMDHLPPENWNLGEFFASDVNKRIDEHAADVCVRQCPRECDRMVYEMMLLSRARFMDSERKIWMEHRLDPNVSIISLFMRHGAAYQGGVVTLSEMSAYSSMQLINNIGGTLGLFVGGTIMTFAELILFAIDYFWWQKSDNQTTKMQELKHTAV